MSVIGVRCDGCGRLSRDSRGYYWDKTLQRGGNISSRGRNCIHDFCDACEEKNAPEHNCPKCVDSYAACMAQLTPEEDTKPTLREHSEGLTGTVKGEFPDSPADPNAAE